MFRSLTTRGNFTLQLLRNPIYKSNIGLFCVNERYFSQGNHQKIIYIPPIVTPRSLAKLTSKRIVDILKEMIKMDYPPTSPDELLPAEVIFKNSIRIYDKTSLFIFIIIFFTRTIYYGSSWLK